MARPPRVGFEGECGHVTARGNERREAFRGDDDRERFLAAVGDARGRSGVTAPACFLMPNPFHLLPATPRGNPSRAHANNLRHPWVPVSLISVAAGETSPPAGTRTSVLPEGP